MNPANGYNSACIHYFSGTGNTSRVAHLIGEGLKRAGCQVSFCNVEHRERSPGGKDCDLYVFAFPVYSFAPPAIMQRYLLSLPVPSSSSRADVAIVAVHGALNARNPLAMGYEGHASAQAAGIMRKKGYHVFLTEAVGYPANITQFLNPPIPKDQRDVIAKADGRVDKIAEDIACRKRSIKRHNILAHLVTGAFGFIFAAIGHRMAGKLYVADMNCVSCGRCAKACPAGAIHLTHGRPKWNWNCEACQRCINICPQGAVQATLPRLTVQLLAMFLPYSLWLNYVMGNLRLETPDIWGSGALIWIAGYLTAVYLADMVLYYLESKPIFKGILAISYTKGFRRYLAPGYDPLEEISSTAITTKK
jgi:ferredoxin